MTKRCKQCEQTFQIMEHDRNSNFCSERCEGRYHDTHLEEDEEDDEN